MARRFRLMEALKPTGIRNIIVNPKDDSDPAWVMTHDPTKTVLRGVVDNSGATFRPRGLPETMVLVADFEDLLAWSQAVLETYSDLVTETMTVPYSEPVAREAFVA